MPCRMLLSEVTPHDNKQKPLRSLEHKLLPRAKMSPGYTLGLQRKLPGPHAAASLMDPAMAFKLPLIHGFLFPVKLHELHEVASASEQV